MGSSQLLQTVSAGAWLPLLYLSLAGIVSFALRKIPGQLYILFKSQFTASLRMDATNEASGVMAQAFLIWYMNTKYAKNTRRFILEPSAGDVYNRGTKGIKGDRYIFPGFGIHTFFFNNVFCWFTCDTENKGYSSKKTIEITFFTRNPQIVSELVELIKHKPKKNEIAIYTPYGSSSRSGEWVVSRLRKKRSIDTVVINKPVKNKLINEISEFIQKKEWYEERGINYKLTYLLHGLPGTGKSSFIVALASLFNKPIYMVNVNSISDEDFQRQLSNVGEDCFIVIEDIDVSEATAARNAENDPEEGKAIKKSPLSMSTLLNTLDGIVSLNGNVIFITTNHIDQLDPALTRRGRVDHIVEIQKLTDEEVKEYIQLVYPTSTIPQEMYFEPITGCDIQALFLENKENFEGFLESLIFKIKERT